MNAEIRAIKTAAEQALSAAYANVRDQLPGKGALAALRDDAFREFDAQGLPHRRVEEWKYTDLRALMRELNPLAAPPDAAASDRDEAAVGSGSDGTVTFGAVAVAAGGGVEGSPPTVTPGVVTVAIGVGTVGVGGGGVGSAGFGRAGFGSFGLGTGDFGRGWSRSGQVAFQAASACRSRSLRPLGTAIVLDELVPLIPSEASEAAAAALNSPAFACAYGPP